jgi:ribonuclease BN (tRNA processing enzyme)
MKLRVLGCSGGIGGRHLRTTSLLIDNDLLIDAGTGLGDVSLAELMLIDHIFLTHSHLDHVCSIPFLVDTVGGMRDKALTVYAIEPTLEIIRNHSSTGASGPTSPIFRPRPSRGCATRQCSLARRWR